jgi:hypothetical protein
LRFGLSPRAIRARAAAKAALIATVNERSSSELLRSARIIAIKEDTEGRER